MGPIRSGDVLVLEASGRMTVEVFLWRKCQVETRQKDQDLWSLGVLCRD